MGRPTNKDKLKKILSEALCISDLKEYIKDLPNDMPIGTVGHFGELLLCDKEDLTTRKGYLTADGMWRSDSLEENVKVFSIYFEDLGPEPD